MRQLSARRFAVWKAAGLELKNSGSKTRVVPATASVVTIINFAFLQLTTNPVAIALVHLQNFVRIRSMHAYAE